MPYLGGDIASLYDESVRAVTVDATRKMTDDGAASIERVARDNTPVKTGRLRASWQRHQARPVTHGFEASVETDVSYAPYVEEGTGIYGPKHAPYLITPKKPGGVLRWVAADGTVVFARYALHPGSPGQHMMGIALNVTEALAQEGAIFERSLAEWVRECEAAGGKQV